MKKMIQKIFMILAVVALNLAPAYSQTTISGGLGGIAGNGTINYLPKFIAGKKIGNSIVSEIGNNIKILNMTIGRGGNGLSNETTAMGVNALGANTTASRSSAFGYNSLPSLTIGDYNTASGAYSLYNLTTGYENTSMGMGSMVFATTSYYCSAFGKASLTDNVSGFRQCAFGVHSLFHSLGNANGGYGAYAGYNLITGDGNLFFGDYSGQYITNGNNNVIVNYSSPSESHYNNTIIISTGANNVRMFVDSVGKTGFGTIIPTSKLHVVGLQQYTNNADALTAGLTIGAFYHTAGILKVVY